MVSADEVGAVLATGPGVASAADTAPFFFRFLGEVDVPAGAEKPAPVCPVLVNGAVEGGGDEEVAPVCLPPLLPDTSGVGVDPRWEI